VTHSNRNFALAYAILVALPLFGLAGVLRSGRKLSAPMSVSGLWKINANQDQFAELPCGKFLLAQDAAFTISQSGRAFTLNFPNSALPATSGTIEGNTINAALITSAVAATEAGCGEHSLSLTAIVDTKANPRSLRGALRVENCPGCAAIEFRGIRDEQANAQETR
jgi:hypothetical protein